MTLCDDDTQGLVEGPQGGMIIDSAFIKGHIRDGGGLDISEPVFVYEFSLDAGDKRREFDMLQAVFYQQS